ncbi:MAG: 4Fe-4S binding protein [Bacteroidales bacterium]|nr:4Fe-4S binding protein [Bacteroidales bacterium]
MLRKIRIATASVLFAGITLLLVDFAGWSHAWLGWLAKVQLLPAVLSCNLVVLAALALLTLVFGRVYCSVLCPLGIMQDIIAWFSRRGNKSRRYKYSYSPAKTVLRWVMLAVMVAAIVLGINSVVALLAPYSNYGRIATTFLAPLYALGNNVLAFFSEKIGGYGFYPVEVWGKAAVTVVSAAVMLILIAVLAWRGGRTWCNTICPVGTVLGCLSRYSILRPSIDRSKCNSCGLCAKGCKASCINSSEHSIDLTRCVACMDCIETCRRNAISYKPVWACKGGSKASLEGSNGAPDEGSDAANQGRRAFLATAGTLAIGTLTARGQDLSKSETIAPILSEIVPKQAPERETRIVPAGAGSHRNMERHCTACQICVRACPNRVLRPSSDLSHILQPECSYEKGYCRPECNKCGKVCPSGAIRPISLEEKSSTQIGHAVVNHSLCIPVTDGRSCGNCAKHCPTGAITMVHTDPSDKHSPRVPAVDATRCIGCGACEYLCPANPISAIRVEGNEIHHIV